jgi:hypothetical protein
MSVDQGNIALPTDPKEKLPPLPAKAPGIPPNDRYREQYGVILVCSGEAEQRRLYEALADIKTSKIKVVVT